MKSFNIIIEIEDYNEIFSNCIDFDHAKEIAERKARDMYLRLNCECRVEVKEVKEVKGAE